MRMNRTTLLVLLASVILAPFAAAAPPDSIDDLGFISGSWRGELFGAHAAEHWSEPEANHMAGLFRMWNDQGPTLYEVLEMVETPSEDGPVIHFRFKHINAIKLDFWETDKPLEFRCTDLENQRAVFTATSDEQRAVTKMIFHREGDTLRITVHGEHDSGEAFAFTAEYQRQD